MIHRILIEVGPNGTDVNVEVLHYESRFFEWGTRRVDHEVLDMDMPDTDADIVCAAIVDAVRNITATGMHEPHTDARCDNCGESGHQRVHYDRT